MKAQDSERFLSLSVPLGDMRAEIMLDYLNETPRGIRASSYKSHTHTVEELYFVEAGALTLELAGEEAALSAGDLLLIAPGCAHRVVSCSDDVRRFNLRFTVHVPEGTLPTERPAWILHKPDAPTRSELAFAAKILRRASDRALLPLEFCRVKAYYSILLSYAFEKLLAQGEEQLPERQNNLIRYVRIDNFFFDRIGERVTLSDLAAELSYSPSQTARILREYYGMSFTEKLSRARLERARQLLDAGMTHKQAAAACGYTTRQGFEALLRRQEDAK